MKIGTNTTLYFNCIVRQDLCWATPPRPSACTTTRQLSKPEFHLWITITIRVEMAPLMTESRSDYQHTRILTHSHSTTTTIWEQTPDFVLQKPQKIGIVNFTGWVCSPMPPCLWKFLQNQKMSPSSKTATSVHLERVSIMFASDREWEAMSERDIGKGETPFWVIRLLINPLLRSEKSSYGLQTQSCYKSCCVYNLIFLPNDNIN